MSPTLIDIVLAGLNVNRDVRDAITGDLLEERSSLVALRGEDAANNWMRLQVLRSLPVMVYGTIREGGLRVLSAAVGAALVALLVVSAVIGVSTALVSRMVSPDAVQSFVILALSIDLSFGIAGGYLAARVGRAAPLPAAFVFGVLAVAVSTLSGAGATAWYVRALQVFLVPATLAGGWLRAQRLARRLSS